MENPDYYMICGRGGPRIAAFRSIAILHPLATPGVPCAGDLTSTSYSEKAEVGASPTPRPDTALLSWKVNTGGRSTHFPAT